MVSRCEDDTVTGDFVDELPNFHIDTFSELEEHSGRFAEVSESDVEKFIEGEENVNTKKRPFRRAPRNQRNREDSSNWIRQLLEPVCFSCKNQDWKRLWTVISPRNFGQCWTPFESLQLRQNYLQRQWLKRHGLGNRPKATTALTDDEIEILFDKKLLGLSSPH